VGVTGALWRRHESQPTFDESTSGRRNSIDHGRASPCRLGKGSNCLLYAMLACLPPVAACVILRLLPRSAKRC
jgi:hypothetical protein